MITFITSIRHPYNSNDYNKIWELFRNTLHSISGQTNKNFRVIVVANKILDDFSSDPKIINTEFVKVDFPRPCDELPPRIPMNALRMDRSSKYVIGIIQAQKYNPDYIMFFDSDDFVHRELTNHVLEGENPHGYLIKYGFKLKNNKIKKLDNFHESCGTSNIVGNKLLLEELNIDNLSVKSTQQEIFKNNSDHFLKMIIGSHKLMSGHYAKRNCEFSIIPFEADIYYMGTGENSTRRLHRKTAWYKPGGKRITEEIMNDFNIGD